MSRYLVTCGPGCKISVWNPTDYQPFLNFEPGQAKILVVSVSPNGNIAALGAESGEVYLVNILKGSCMGVIGAHSREVTGISWISDHHFITVS